MLNPGVTYGRRVNPARGTIAYFARYVEPGTGRIVRRKLFRTEPQPSGRSLRRWDREAARLCLELQGRLADMGQEQNPAKVEPMWLYRGARLYLAWCLKRGRIPATVANMDGAIRAFLQHVQETRGIHDMKNMSAIAKHHAASWREALLERGLSPSTVNMNLACVSGWFRWALDAGYVHVNPFRQILRCRVEAKRAVLRVVTPADLAALLEAIPEVARRPTALLAYTGMRQGEAKRCRWEDWDQGAGTIFIQPIGPEWNKRHERSFPLCPQAVEVLESLQAEAAGPYIIGLEGGKWPLRGHFNRWLRKGGVRPHDLRRFFITAMETIGAPASVIDDLVGHSPGKVRAAYTPMDNIEAARPWVEKFGEWLRAGQAGTPSAAPAPADVSVTA